MHWRLGKTGTQAFGPGCSSSDAPGNSIFQCVFSARPVLVFTVSILAMVRPLDSFFLFIFMVGRTWPMHVTTLFQVASRTVEMDAVTS